MRHKIALYLYFIVVACPLILGLGYALLYSFGFVGLMNEGFTLTHWARLWQSSDVWKSIGYSAYLTAISLLLIISLALVFSWQFIQKPISQHWYHVLYLPLMFPPLIATFAWFYLLSPGGILARLAYHFGWIQDVQGFPRWVNDDWSIGILIVHLFLMCPLFILLFLEQSRKERIPDLQKIALSLGSSVFAFFRTIYVPLILQKSRSMLWLYGIFVMGSYEVPLLLGQSSPRTITILITDKMTRFNLADVPVGYAIIVLYSFLVIGIVTFFIRRKELALDSGKLTG